MHWNAKTHSVCFPSCSYIMKKRVHVCSGGFCFSNDVLSCIEIYIRAFMLSILLFHLFISFIREIPLEKEAGICAVSEP